MRELGSADRFRDDHGMKLLFLATGCDGSIPLGIPAEIALLEGIFRNARQEFMALPAATVEQIPSALFRRSCDVLHFTAHGEGDVLQTMTGRGGIVAASPDHLLAFIDAKRGPRLLYLNACDSAGIAKAMVAKWPNQGVPFAIGVSAPVSADYCTAAAGSFYERLLGGMSLQSAFDSADQQLLQASSGRVCLKLHPAPGQDAKETYFRPQILARLARRYERGDGQFEIIFGIRNAPRETRQTVFFTDDDDMIDSPDDALGNQLCQISRRQRDRSGIVWCDRLEAWRIKADFDVHAVGVTYDEGHWFVSSTFVDAFQRYHAIAGIQDQRSLDPDALAKAVEELARWT